MTDNIRAHDPRDTGDWRARPQAPTRRIWVGGHPISNEDPITVIAGLNVLEAQEVTERVAHHLIEVCDDLKINLIFKASFDKANRSRLSSERGPGLSAGLRALDRIKTRFDVPLITDIHEPEQARAVAEVVDLIQIPAFLCRQTDLLRAACHTGLPLHIKKMQMMAPQEMEHVLRKCEEWGHYDVMLCERGTSFGYRGLVTDPLSFSVMKRWGAPVSFDVTHALQLPGASGGSAGGRGHLTAPLAFAGVSQGIAALFLECHPQPDEAPCDGPCALPLGEAFTLLDRVKSLDIWAKSKSLYDHSSSLT